MKKILILGGTGFIGRTLVPMLCGNDITLLSRSKKNRFGLKQIQCDRDKEDFDKLPLADNYDVVIDISAMRKERTARAYSTLRHKTNKYLHISSAAVYRDSDTLDLEESMPAGGGAIWGKYGKDKAECEDFLLAQEDCSICILRPTYMFGEHNHLDRESFVWSRMLNRQPIFIPENSTAKIQFTDVQLLGTTIKSLIEDSWHAGVFNIANKEKIGLESWVKMLGEICGKAPIIKKIAISAPLGSNAFFPFGDHNVSICTEKFENTFHVNQQDTLKDRFSRTYQFAKQTRPFRLRLTVKEKELYQRFGWGKLLSKKRKIFLHCKRFASYAYILLFNLEEKGEAKLRNCLCKKAVYTPVSALRKGIRMINESKLDRVIRVVMGVMLLSLMFIGPKTLWGLAGLALLTTGFVGFCPTYKFFGFSTCPLLED